MNLKLTILLFTCFYTLHSYAQSKPEPFQITLPQEKVKNSLYNSIRLLDIREDTMDFGIVQKGAFNRQAKVVSEIPLAQQFSNILNALTDNTAKSGELLLLLRQCSFAGGALGSYVSDIVVPGYDPNMKLPDFQNRIGGFNNIISKFLGSVLNNGVSNFISNGYYPSLFPAYRDPSNNYRFNYGNLTGTAGDIFTGLILYFKK